MDDRSVDISLLQQELSERILCVGVLGILPDCLLKRGFRLCGVAGFHRAQPTLIRAYTPCSSGLRDGIAAQQCADERE
jgi:hypothetical protein